MRAGIGDIKAHVRARDRVLGRALERRAQVHTIIAFGGATTVSSLVTAAASALNWCQKNSKGGIDLIRGGEDGSLGVGHAYWHCGVLCLGG